MDKLDHYRQIICDFLSDYSQTAVSPQEPIEAELIFDEQRDRYLITYVGWQDDERIYGCPIHLDIIDGQVWLQHNSTEIEVDQELIKRGVPAEDMILGLQPPFVREILRQRS